MAQEPRPTLLDFILSQYAKLDSQTLKAIKRIIDTFGNLYLRLRPSIENIVLLLEAKADMTVAQIRKTQEFKRLINAINDELNNFSSWARVELNDYSIEAIEQAIKDTRALYDFLGIDVPVATPDAAQILISYLEPGGALAGRINLWAGHAVEQVSNAIIEGVALGRNPRKIAADIQKSFGVALSDALRTTRTVQIWSYRETTRLNYLGSNVVKGWIWYSVLDPIRTCMSCVAMHGTVHSLEEQLEDHYNGLCTMLPLLEGVDYGLISGKDWFNSLPEANQIKLMGIGKYDAYKAGKIDIDQMSKVYDDPVYGRMRTETPLKDLL